VFSSEGDETPGACPGCKAEAGLEPEKGASLAMKLFGALLFGAIAISVVGTVAAAMAS
jgi:hypothetical protein